MPIKEQWSILGDEWRIREERDMFLPVQMLEFGLKGKLLMKFKCHVRLASEGVRFGVKLLPEGAVALGEGDIRTPESVLIHIGKDANSDNIVSNCSAGLEPGRTTGPGGRWLSGETIVFEVAVSSGGRVVCFANDHVMCVVPCNPSQRQRLILMAWSDGPDALELKVTDIRISVTKPVGKELMRAGSRRSLLETWL